MFSETYPIFMATDMNRMRTYSRACIGYKHKVNFQLLGNNRTLLIASFSNENDKHIILSCVRCYVVYVHICCIYVYFEIIREYCKIECAEPTLMWLPNITLY